MPLNLAALSPMFYKTKPNMTSGFEKDYNKLLLIRYSAICTAFNAAPFLI